MNIVVGEGSLRVPRSARSGQRMVRAGMRLSLIYWLSLLAILTLLALVERWETFPIFVARCVMTGFSLGLSWIVIRFASRVTGSFAARAVAVSAIAILAASIHYPISFFVLRFAEPSNDSLLTSESLRNVLFWVGPYLGWTALFLAQQYSREVIDRERQLSDLRAQAQDAQLRALRYQINPHFLFNTLNALATLIEEQDVATAERMVLTLSGFLRSTLALDPMQDILLGQELEIQRGYLDIERERFSDRLTVEIDVPERLRSARVPSLILQPLIENAVKHGVSAVDGAVHIRIWADADRNMLDVHVDNDPSPQIRVANGTGLGLKNVAERLGTRFGEAGRLTTGRLPSGHFRATVTLPLRYGPP